MNPLDILQGFYLHRTAQQRKILTYIHSSSGIRIHEPGIKIVQPLEMANCEKLGTKF